MPPIVETALIALAGYVAAVLDQAVRPYLAEHLVTPALDTLKSSANTTPLEEPGGLSALLKSGTVKPGEFVSGTAFFSLHTNGPATIQPSLGFSFKGADTNTTSTFDLGGLFGMSPSIPIPGGSTLPHIPIAQFCSSIKFPIVDDVKRVGFLYPKEMSGFAIPSTYSGSPLYHRREICLVNQKDLPNIEHAIVKYRGQVVEIPRSAFREVLPKMTDEFYDTLRTNGFLNVLSFVTDDTYIKYSEPKLNDFIYGGQFVRLHWEDKTILADNAFPNILDESIKLACEEVDLPLPVRNHFTHNSKSAEHTFDRWLGHGFIVSTPHPLSMLDFQQITDISSGNDMEDRARFEKMKGIIIECIRDNYNLADETKDVDGVHDFTNTPHTILQSTAAQGITHPMLVAVRNWLEKTK